MLLLDPLFDLVTEVRIWLIMEHGSDDLVFDMN